MRHLTVARRIPPFIIFAGSNQKFLNRQINIMSEPFLYSINVPFLHEYKTSMRNDHLYGDP
jgi:hypothetical protein